MCFISIFVSSITSVSHSKFKSVFVNTSNTLTKECTLTLYELINKYNFFT